MTSKITENITLRNVARSDRRDSRRFCRAFCIVPLPHKHNPLFYKRLFHMYMALINTLNDDVK